MNASRSNGFTLIEVLIAITLLGVMVVLLFSSLRIVAQSWNAGEDKIAAVNQKAVVYQFFKRHLTAIRPLPMLGDQENFGVDAGQMAFQGLPQSLRFVAALPAASARKGLQLFNIQLEPKQSAILQVSLIPYRSVDVDADVVDPPVILLENIAELRFAYFGKIEDVAELIWRDEWTVADRLPRLIKVSIALKDGSYWPDMVFPLKITSSHTAEIGFGDDSTARSIQDADVQ